jgi:hypothetical protein
MQWVPVTFYPIACAADQMTKPTPESEADYCAREANRYKQKFLPALGLEVYESGFWEVLYDFGLGDEKFGYQQVGRIKLLAIPQSLTKYWFLDKHRVQDTSQLGKLCFIFFAGSVTKSDWLANIDFKETDFCGLPGHWHGGYVKIWRGIMQHESWATLLSKINLNNCDPAFGISGHSLGGALAFLTSACINQGSTSSEDFRLMGTDFSAPHPKFANRPKLYVKATVVFGCPGVVKSMGEGNVLAPRHMMAPNFDAAYESLMWGGNFWFGNFVVGRKTWEWKDLVYTKKWVESWAPDPASEVGQSLGGYTLPYGLVFDEGKFVYFKRDFVPLGDFENGQGFKYHLNVPYRGEVRKLISMETIRSVLKFDIHDTEHYVAAARKVWDGFPNTTFSNELALEERASWMIDCCCGIVTPKPKWYYWPVGT